MGVDHDAQALPTFIAEPPPSHQKNSPPRRGPTLFPPPYDRSTKPPQIRSVEPESTTSNRSSEESEIHQNPRNIQSNPFATPNASQVALAQAVTQLPLKPRVDDKKPVVRREKRMFITALLLAKYVPPKYGLSSMSNLTSGFFIFATWHWPKYYYILLPLITITVALNAIMVFSVIIFKIIHTIFPEKKLEVITPENIVYVVPCYNETLEEVTKSLESIVRQQDIDHHRRAIIVICDGRVRGPGMEKTTAEYLLEDVFVNRTSRRFIKGAYNSWTDQPANVEVQSGTYQGMPYYCIIKQQNEGKRDSLICVRSFLHVFNIRATNPASILSPDFFGEMAHFLQADAGMETADVLIGIDADTLFADDCVTELLKESRYPECVGVCGYVVVDFSLGRWNLWRLYQNTEYTISQGLRRLHQSTVTHKVSCLPGCCQLLKICEATCGTKILYELFGYCPTRGDSILKQIRATASEDRNHVCLMLSHFPKSQTRQALKARAITDVPRSWSVFLSQRRRWTLGATSNDLMLTTAPGVQWFERIIAIGNCVVWFCNIFVLASVASLIVACISTYPPPSLHPSK
jgi:chitin synthase